MASLKTSTFVAAAIGLGLLAGCVSRTTVRERERVTTQPRILEERTVVVPQPPEHEETTVIKKRREYSEED